MDAVGGCVGRMGQRLQQRAASAPHGTPHVLRINQIERHIYCVQNLGSARRGVGQLLGETCEHREILQELPHLAFPVCDCDTTQVVKRLAGDDGLLGEGRLFEGEAPCYVRVAGRLDIQLNALPGFDSKSDRPIERLDR